MDSKNLVTAGSSGRALLVLLGATLIWGSTFVVTKDALADISVWGLLFWRFGVAALVLLLVAGRSLRTLRRQDVRHGVIVGLLLGLGFCAQTVGLTLTTAAANGFITGLMVVLTPFVAWGVFGRHFDHWTWLAVALATIGLTVMSWSSGDAPSRGVLLTLLGAALFAGQISSLSQWSAGVNAIALTAVQVSTAFALSAFVASTTGHVCLPHGGSTWAAIGYLALMATVVGFVAQVWSQARLSAARAAVIMTMEPVFAGTFAVLGGESLTARLVIGGGVIVAAMLVVELTGSRAQA